MTRAIQSDNYPRWAGSLAQEHLKTGTALNGLVGKLARAEQLNPEQTRRLGEATNVAVYQHLLPDREGGDVRYERCDPGTVVDELAAVPPSKEAGDLDISDYLIAPPKAAHDLSQMSAIPACFLESEKRASAEAASIEQRMSCFETRQLLAKLAAADEELKFERADLDRLTLSERSRFTDVVRDLVAGGAELADLLKAAMVARSDQKDALADLFAETIAKLAAKGYLKVGGVEKCAAVDIEALRKELAAALPGLVTGPLVVHRRHPLLLAIDTITAANRKKQENDRARELLGQEMRQAKRVLVSLGGI